METSQRVVDLFDWVPRFSVCVLFGHEVDGVDVKLLGMADTFVRIPMLGKKHSLNVATARGGCCTNCCRSTGTGSEQGEWVDVDY